MHFWRGWRGRFTQLVLLPVLSLISGGGTFISLADEPATTNTTTNATTNTPATTNTTAGATLIAVAKVVAILGKAQVSRGGAPYVGLEPGATLRAGDVVRTATSSAMDIDLGPGPGIVRLTEGSVLGVEKLGSSDFTNADIYEVELALRLGELLATTKQVPTEAHFDVKTTAGIARVLRGQYRIQARGYVVVLEGKVIMAQVVPNAEPVAHTLTAPPPSYYTPAAGVKPAPRDLVKEVTRQLHAKIAK